MAKALEATGESNADQTCAAAEGKNLYIRFSELNRGKIPLDCGNGCEF